MEGKPKIRTGTISYTIIEDEQGNLDIKYGTSVESDVVAFCIVQNILEDMVPALEIEKRIAPNKQRKHIATVLRKAIDARFGVKIVLDYLQPQYLKYLKSQDEQSKDKENKAG